jgi:hypothetical protein
MTNMNPHRRDDWKGPDESAGKGCLGVMLAMAAAVLAVAAALLG